MKRRKPSASVLDLGAARKRAAGLDKHREVAAAWVAHVRANARQILAVGDDLTLELARLLWDSGNATAAQAVAKALPAAQSEQFHFERWRDFLRDVPEPDARQIIERRAARGDRAAQRVLEER